MKAGAIPTLVAMLAGIASSTVACAQQPAGRAPERQATAAATSDCRIDSASVVPAVRQRHEEKKDVRVEQLDHILARDRADVLLLGDSITERWPQASLDAAFPGERVINAGVSGDWVTDLLFRLDGRTSQVAGTPQLGISHWQGQRPRLVTIMIGTNNLRFSTPCYIASGIVAAAQKARTLFPTAQIVVLSILPRGNPQGQFADKIAATNALVEGEARRLRQFRYLDLTPAFTCAKGADCDLAIPRNYIHPSDKGYAQLAALLRTNLSRR